jgi:hypothetical protein
MASSLADPGKAAAAPAFAAGATLTAGDARLLVQLSDPEAAPPADALDDPLRLGRILRAADRHGVLPIVVRKASALARAQAGGATDIVLQDYRERLVGWIGQSMLLDRHARNISGHLARAGVKAAIVKGPTFANALYRDRSDRPFTDIDFLIPAEHLAAANRVMPALDFVRPQKSWDNSDRDREYKWLGRENRSVLIELHGDLVHYPMLRRQVSFGYDRLAAIEDGVRNRPAALLMVAVVHAACGHKFHQLSLLVDVLQAVRRLTADEEARFVQAAVSMGARLEAAVALRLVSRVFDEPRASALASRLGGHWMIRLGDRLMSPEVILADDIAGQRRSRVRRHGFRLLQQIGPLRP